MSHGHAALVERLDAQIEQAVDDLNAALGLPTTYAEAVELGVSRVTHGYIGNLPTGHPAGGPQDDRLHFVFLPHPHRVGTPRDRIGGWRYGDVDGMRAALVQISGAITVLAAAADPCVRRDVAKVAERRTRLDLPD